MARYAMLLCCYAVERYVIAGDMMPAIDVAAAIDAFAMALRRVADIYVDAAMMPPCSYYFRHCFRAIFAIICQRMMLPL